MQGVIVPQVIKYVGHILRHDQMIWIQGLYCFSQYSYLIKLFPRGVAFRHQQEMDLRISGVGSCMQSDRIDILCGNMS